MKKIKGIIVLVLMFIACALMYMFIKWGNLPVPQMTQPPQSTEITEITGITKEQFIHLKDYAIEFIETSIKEDTEPDFTKLEDELEAINLSEIGEDTEEIIRGEALYILVEELFPDELDTVDLDEASITNPDSGLPTSLYKGLAISFDKKILTSDETRWDEALTKSEAVEFIVNALKSDPSIKVFNSKQGTVEGYVAETEEETTEVETTGGTDVELTEDDYKEPLPEEEQTPDEEMSELEKEAEALGTTPEALAEARKLMEQWAAEDAQKNNTQIDVDYPGMTPHDPSQDYQGVRPLVDDPNGANVKIQ